MKRILQVVGVMGEDLSKLTKELKEEFAIVGSTIFVNRSSILDDYYESAQNILKFNTGTNNGAGWDCVSKVDFDAPDAFEEFAKALTDDGREVIFHRFCDCPIV